MLSGACSVRGRSREAGEQAAAAHERVSRAARRRRGLRLRTTSGNRGRPEVRLGDVPPGPRPRRRPRRRLPFGAARGFPETGRAAAEPRQEHHQDGRGARFSVRARDGRRSVRDQEERQLQQAGDGLPAPHRCRTRGLASRARRRAGALRHAQAAPILRHRRLADVPARALGGVVRRLDDQLPLLGRVLHQARYVALVLREGRAPAEPRSRATDRGRSGLEGAARSTARMPTIQKAGTPGTRR